MINMTEFQYFKTGSIGVCAVGIKGKPFKQMTYWANEIREINIYNDREPNRWKQYERHEMPARIVSELEKRLMK
jgi:hypothetical protein